MKHATWLVLFTAATLGGCTRLTPEQQIVHDAASALGGQERIQAVKTLTLEGEGTNGNLGQDLRPEATGQSFTVTDYRRSFDIPGKRVRIEQTRTPTFTYFQGPAPQKQVLGLDGEVGYNVAANGNATRIAAAATKDRRAEFYHHPITIVRAGLDPATKLMNPRTQGAQSVVDVTTADGLTFTLAIDGTTKLPASVSSTTDNTNLGDVVIQTSFDDYQDVNGLRLPARLTLKNDNFTLSDLRLTTQTVDGDVGDLAAPAAAASAPLVTAPPPANVQVQDVAKGVKLLGGQSHHSMLVEFSDHLTLIEAPQNDTRTLAVIAKVKELYPNKPLTHVINSHHHFDHSGGIRAAVSQGLTVITHKGNAAFYQEVVGRPHTIVPDALAMNPKPVTVETVDDEMILKDEDMTVHLYHLAGNAHSDTMLVAYFPTERILVEVDVYTPGGAAQPYAANLLENIKKRNLRVDRIVPLHGMPGPFSDLVKAVQPRTSD